MKFKTPHGNLEVHLWRGDKLRNQKPDLQQCRVAIHGSGRAVSFYQCQRKGTVERKGEDGTVFKFCATHDPFKKAQREAERSNRWKHEADVRAAQYALEDVLDKIGNAVLEGDLKDKKLIAKLFALQSKALKAKAKLKKLQG